MDRVEELKSFLIEQFAKAFENKTVGEIAPTARELVQKKIEEAQELGLIPGIKFSDFRIDPKDKTKILYTMHIPRWMQEQILKQHEVDDELVTQT